MSGCLLDYTIIRVKASVVAARGLLRSIRPGHSALTRPSSCDPERSISP